MKLTNIFHRLDPIPILAILAFALPFLIIGLGGVRKARVLVKDFIPASGTVVENEYRSRTDPEDSAKTYSSYYPVVRFTTTSGNEAVFTDQEGSYPPRYEVGEVVDVLYNAQNPQDATINSWLSIWMGPLWFTMIGLLPILGLVAWAIWRYVRAERQFQATRQARLR